MKKFLTTSAALKLTCVGFFLGVLLRVIFMLYCFDSSTGFYTDGGRLAGLCLSIVVLACVLAGVCCGFARGAYGSYVHRKNPLLSLTAVLAGIAMLVCGWVQLRNLYRVGVFTYKTLDAAYIMQIVFAGATLLLGLALLAVPLGALGRWPGLSLIGVAWGAAYVMMVYLSYARSALFTENVFVVFGGTALLLALLYLSETLLGIHPEKSSRRLFITGTAAVVLTVTHALSNLYLRMLGEWYKGELPNSVQLATLAAALFVLTFMATYRSAMTTATPPPLEVEVYRADKPETPTSHFRGD